MFTVNQPDGRAGKVTFRILKYFAGRKLHEVFILHIYRILTTKYNASFVKQ